MTLKDKVKGLLSFLDTDDVNELEELEEEKVEEPRRQESTVVERPRPAARPVTRPEVVTPEHRSVSARPSREYVAQVSQVTEHPIQNRREEMVQQQGDSRTVIAVKYPKRYEDARGIVDLLIENESVLIDFQYMVDSQARRCIDFIDGASRVLFGGLNKVGNTMYLLTPANVVVNVDELVISAHGQDTSYDYDMKRR